MHVTICIVGYRNSAEIVQCLDALSRSTHHDFEVVITENGGDAAHAELTRAVPARLDGGQTVTCLNAGANLGYAGGVNICIRARPDSGAWWIGYSSRGWGTARP